MTISAVGALRSVTEKNPGFTALYAGVILVNSLEFLWVPLLITRCTPGILARDGRRRRYLSVLILLLFSLFAVYLTDIYVSTKYARAITNEVERQVVDHILTSDEVCSGESDRGTYTYNTIEYGWELNNFITLVKLNWVTPVVFLLVSTCILLRSSGWVLNVINVLQILVALAAPMVVVFGNADSYIPVEDLTVRRYSYLDDVYQNAKTVVSHDGLPLTLTGISVNASVLDKETDTVEMRLLVRIIIPCTFALMLLLFCSVLYVFRMKLDLAGTIELLLTLAVRLYYVGLLLQSGTHIVSQYSVLSGIMRKLGCNLSTKENCDFAEPPEDMSSGLQFHEVTFTYPNSIEPTIKHCSISFPVNSGTALVGQSGSGKSTVLNLLKGFISPTHGHITLHGIPLKQYPNRNRVMGFVMQQPQIFNTTVWENIVYGCPELDRSGLLDKLEVEGWDHVLKSTGLELDHAVGKGGDRLSGGQKQIVQLLRVLILNPLVLLMDEPTAALDDANSEFVMNFIVKILKSKIVIMVTHDERLLSYMDRVVYHSELKSEAGANLQSTATTQ